MSYNIDYQLGKIRDACESTLSKVKDVVTKQEKTSNQLSRHNDDMNYYLGRLEEKFKEMIRKQDILSEQNAKMVIQNELLLAEQCPFEFSRYIVEKKNYEIPFSIYLARLKGIYGYAPKKEKEEEEPAVKRTMSMH